MPKQKVRREKKQANINPDIDTAYCATCGAPITFGFTMTRTDYAYVRFTKGKRLYYCKYSCMLSKAKK